MIDPTAADILCTVEHTLQTVIVPTLGGTPERSAAATILHLLRHVGLRIEQEGQVLYDDLQAIRPVLEQARDYFHGLGRLQDAARLQAALDIGLPQDRYPSLRMVADVVRQAQAALEAALVCLIAMRDDHAEAADYRMLRQTIRDYLADQIRREAALVHPAFEGKGPRR